MGAAAALPYLPLLLLSFGFLLCASAVTDPLDVAALRALYGALNSPPQLVGWNAETADPCGEGSWTGVHCWGRSVISIRINSLGLGGYLGLQLGDFWSLKELDVSDNSIGGEIPYSLPKNASLINLALNRFTMNIPATLPSLKYLGHLNLSHNLLSGIIGDVFGGLVDLKELDLSYNNFSGDLPISFSSLTHLEGLYLQENNFTGAINFLAYLPLSVLDIQNNHFSGVIPSKINSIPKLNVEGNKFELGYVAPSNFTAIHVAPASQPPVFAPVNESVGSVSVNEGVRNAPVVTSTETRGSAPQSHFRRKQGFSKKGLAAIITGILIAAAACSFLVKVLTVPCKNKMKRTKLMSEPLYVLPITSSRDEQNHSQTSSQLRDKVLTSFRQKRSQRLSRRKYNGRRSKSLEPVKLYSILDVLTATNNFSEENLLGEGSFGLVYKAVIPDGQVLAVKMIDLVGLAVYEEDEFLDAVCAISRLRHPNIMGLRGYCVERGQHILAYDYAINGSLEDYLQSGPCHTKYLPWSARMNIAFGVARGLEYLHWTCSPPVAHENLKASNILLDAQFIPRLGECGLAALKPLVTASTIKASQFPLRCNAYNAPEYGYSEADKTKGDIFRFGVILLELLTGRKSFDRSKPNEEQALVNWASSHLHDFALFEASIDPAVKGTFSSKILSRFADIILLCIQRQPEFRPSITEIGEMLANLIRSMPQVSGDELIEGIDPCNQSFRTTSSQFMPPVP